MDFPNYMILNPMHIEFQNVPKKVKILGGPLILPGDTEVAWTACPECVNIGLAYSTKTNQMPNWFKAIAPTMGGAKLNLK